MLNTIWIVMIFAGIITGILTGRMGQISDAVLESCVNSVNLVITMLGSMCLWSGLMKAAQKAGLVNSLAKLLKRVFKFLFPGIPENIRKWCHCYEHKRRSSGAGKCSDSFGDYGHEGAVQC